MENTGTGKGPALSVAEAALWFKVAPSTVRMWMRTVEPAEVRGMAKYYWFDDLTQAEREARNAPTQPGRKKR